MGKDRSSPLKFQSSSIRFNPCFNGWMGKDLYQERGMLYLWESFNPCFNGWMGKDLSISIYMDNLYSVSILVLMDGWVKTGGFLQPLRRSDSFNPCFNGWMGKDARR